MSANPYQLLLRHSHLLNEGTLIVGAEADTAGYCLQIVQHTPLSILTWDWQTYQAYPTLTEQQRIFAMPDTQHFTDAKRVILLWPKSKLLALTLLKKIATVHQECWIVGENDAGGRSIHKATQGLTREAVKQDSARHCSLWHLTLQPQTEFNWLTQAQSFSHHEHAFLTLPGVFNHGKLDEGTALLLEYVPAPRHGKLLDLGCGSGVIGLSMKSREPALDVTLADVDAFALQSARLNAVRLGLSANILASDGLSAIEERFDYIVSNPPFHQGKDTSYQFAEQLFAHAKSKLTAEGQLWLVANRHLNYEAWAEKHFSDVRIMAQERGFKLIYCGS